MSDYDVTRIEKPRYFGIRPLVRGRGKRQPYVIGFDSEADHGRPFLYQFSLPGMTEGDVSLVIVPETKHAGFMQFQRFIIEHCTNRHLEYLIYGFNLQYEWTQIFGDFADDIGGLGEVVMLVTVVRPDGSEQEWEWTIYNDKRVFATIRNKSGHVMIRFLDARMFFATSLDNAAKMLGLGEKYVGDIERDKINRASLDDPEFLMYARRDAHLTRLLGEYIVGLHETYDIRQTISAPHFASSVFRHHYLGAEVKLPENDLEQAGLWSYHGGKNGYYLDAPAEIAGCYQYDITSAYPEAMRQLPNIETAKWVEVPKYHRSRHAIYVVTVQYQRCAFRGMLNHDGTWPESGYIENLCLTSYELDAMIERHEVRILACHGWELRGKSGGPLMRYVDDFFSRKATAIGAERETMKLFLNSLYGKFFQKVALGIVGYYDMETREIIEHNPDGPFDWRAGGLYHPPIASLITGFVRAKIHRLEHRYDAIMTSTDGMFARKPPQGDDIGIYLGGLTVEHGTLRILRDRLYVFDSPDLAKPKVAYFSFWGSLDELRALPLEHGTYDYTTRHMVTLRESRHRLACRCHPDAPDGARHRAGSFIDQPRVITI